MKSNLRVIYRKLKLVLRVRWFKTIRVNFKLLPFHIARKLPIVIICPIRLGKLTGCVSFTNPEKIKFGSVIIGRDIDNMPIGGVPFRLTVVGELTFEGRAVFSPGTQIIVWPKSRLYIGNNITVGTGVVIKSTLDVHIGAYSCITSGCFIMDSNIHPIKDIESGIIKRFNQPIVIGKATWLNMNTAVLAGSVIPSYSITARNTIIGKDYSEHGQGLLLAGAPAQVVKKGVQRVYDIELERCLTNYFMDNTDIEFYQGEKGYFDFDDNENFAETDIKNI